MERVSRPLPPIGNKLYEPYFRGLQEQKILVQSCLHCHRLQWPPRELCFRCQSSEFTWVEVPQEGQVYTYTISYRAPHPWFKDKLPYGIVIVDLGQGIRMLGNYFGQDVESLDCDMRMKAKFEVVNEQFTLLQWVKA